MVSCPTCGFTAPVQPSNATWRPVEDTRQSTWAPPASTWQSPTGRTNDPVSSGVAIAALLLNVLVLPGLGSLIGGRIQEGIWQLVLSLGAVIISFLAVISVVGIILLPVLFLAPIAAWVWGLITGIQLVQRAS